MILTGDRWKNMGPQQETPFMEMKENRGWFSPNGQHILTLQGGTSPKLWDLEGNFIHELLLSESHKDFAYSRPIFSPDGRFVVIQYFDSMFEMFFSCLADVNGKLIANLTDDGEVIEGVEFTLNGQRFLTYSLDEGAKMWNLQGELLTDFHQHTAGVNDARFSPDGNTILTCSKDATAKLWNLSGEVLADFTRHTSEVTHGCFSKDGKYVLTLSLDGTAKVWPTPQAIYEWLQSPECRLPVLPEITKQKYGLSIPKNKP